MTDQQRLRDALQDAVPEPPLETWQGTLIRARSHSARRIRMTVAAGLAGAVAVAGVAVWASRPHESGSNVTGSGAAVCHRLLRDAHGGRYVDSRLVDGPTVARWLEQVPLHLDPAKYRHDGRVAVCLASGRTAYVIYILAGHGDDDRVPIYGLLGKGGAAQTMAALDRLRTGGQKTTGAPFTCSGPPTEHYLDVTTSLPEGATAARICFHGLFFDSAPGAHERCRHVGRGRERGPYRLLEPGLQLLGRGGRLSLHDRLPVPAWHAISVGRNVSRPDPRWGPPRDTRPRPHVLVSPPAAGRRQPGVDDCSTLSGLVCRSSGGRR